MVEFGRSEIVVGVDDVVVEPVSVVSPGWVIVVSRDVKVLDVTCSVVGGGAVVSFGVVVDCVVFPSHSSKAMVSWLIFLSLALTGQRI